MHYEHEIKQKWIITQTNPTHCARVSFACSASSDLNCFSSCDFSCLDSFIIAVFRLRCFNVDAVYILILYSTPISIFYVRGSCCINISLLLLIKVKYSIVIIDNSHTTLITSFFFFNFFLKLKIVHGWLPWTPAAKQQYILRATLVPPHYNTLVTMQKSSLWFDSHMFWNNESAGEEGIPWKAHASSQQTNVKNRKSFALHPYKYCMIKNNLKEAWTKIVGQYFGCFLSLLLF